MHRSPQIPSPPGRATATTHHYPLYDGFDHSAMCGEVRPVLCGPATFSSPSAIRLSPKELL